VIFGCVITKTPSGNYIISPYIFIEVLFLIPSNIFIFLFIDNKLSTLVKSFSRSSAIKLIEQVLLIEELPSRFIEEPGKTRPSIPSTEFSSASNTSILT